MTEIAVQSIVRLVSDPAKKGVVMSVGGTGEDTRYTVFIDGEMRTYRSMIDDENERYDIRRKQIEDKAACADILVDKIANGVITVEG